MDRIEIAVELLKMDGLINVRNDDAIRFYFEQADKILKIAAETEPKQSLDDMHDEIVTHSDSLRIAELEQKVKAWEMHSDLLEQQLAQEREANRWIPVTEEKQPKYGAMHIVKTDKHTHCLCRYDEDGFFYLDDRGSVYVNNVTHWKPIN